MILIIDINESPDYNLLKSEYHASSFFLIAYIIIDLLRFFNKVPLLAGNIFYVILGSLAIGYTIFKIGIYKQIIFIGFILFYTLFGSIGILFNQNSSIQELFWPYAFMGLAMLLLNFKMNFKLAKYSYYSTLIILLSKILISGGVNNIDAVSSRNTISIMVLIYFSIYAISAYQNNVGINLIPVICGLLVTISAIGRSGILTFILLTMLFLIFEFKGDKQKIRNPVNWIILAFILAFVLLVAYNLPGSFFKEVISNFENRGLESVRTQIWSDYLSKTYESSFNFILGAPIKGTYLLDTYNNNLHNSFFMLHAKYGIIPLLTILILTVKALFSYLKKKNYLFLSLLVVVLFRMQFDYTNFNAQLDIILFYLLFFEFYEGSNNKVDKINKKIQGR